MPEQLIKPSNIDTALVAPQLGGVALCEDELILNSGLDIATDSQREEYLDSLVDRAGFLGFSVENMRRNYDEAIFVYDREGTSQHAAYILLGDGAVPRHKEVPLDDWREISKDPDSLNQTNKFLLNAFELAQDFLGERDKINGIAIDGGNHFGMEQGTWSFGARVSFEQRVKPLMGMFNSCGEQELHDYQLFLASEFVHELVHRNYQEGTGFGVNVPMETQAHAVQLLFEPKDNRIFNNQLEASLNNEAMKEMSGDQLDGYDKAQCLAVAIVTERLATHNLAIALCVKKGLTPDVFKEIQFLITEQDIEYLQNEVLPEFLSRDCDSLKDEAELALVPLRQNAE